MNLDALARKATKRGVTLSDDDAVLTTKAAIRAALAQARQEALEEGYILGFNESGEGWNGEYPYGDNDQDPSKDAKWIEHRDAAIRAMKEANK